MAYISEEYQIEIDKEERFQLLDYANSDWKARLGKLLVSMGVEKGTGIRKSKRQS